MAYRRAATGRPVPAIDGLLAATAQHHNLTRVTRNLRNFTDFAVPLINPFNTAGDNF